MRSSREQIGALAARLNALHEEQRTQIAREIRDELAQELIALKMDLSWLLKKLPENLKSLRNKAKSMLKLMDEIIQSLRKISTALRPAVLDDLGLIAAIQWQAQEFQDRSRIKCEFNSNLRDVHLDKDLSTAVFRILQETLTNVACHAKPTTVIIDAEEKAGKFILRVKDNGRGIKESEASNPKSLGLLEMRELAFFFKGELKIKGTPRKGTTITLCVPVAKLQNTEG